MECRIVAAPGALALLRAEGEAWGGANSGAAVKFGELSGSIAASEGGGFSVVIPENWLQGRTTYGGLTAALCLEAAMRAFPDLPPLRSADIAFVGPAGGPVRVAATILRRGKSVVFVNADLYSKAALATRAVFAFGAARAGGVEANFLPMRDFPPPEGLEGPDPERLPVFARNFDLRYLTGGRPFSGSRDCDVHLWVRHRDAAASGLAALVALADMPPPALFPLMPRPARLSTVAWSFNLIGPAPAAPEWLLLQTRAETASDGYTSQDMFVWRRDGTPLLAGRQSVAIFL
jgi:acyl-CoA thioesterase